MTDKKTIDKIDSGEVKVVPKYQYYLNYLTPIVTILGFLIGGIFWFANAESRMFTTPQIRYETEMNTMSAKERTLDKLDDRYVPKEEIKDLKQVIENLNKNITELKIELAKIKR
jgi:hypothetical protein